MPTNCVPQDMEPPKQRFVQSKLTSGFFTPKCQTSPETSPYFAQAPPNGSNPSLPHSTSISHLNSSELTSTQNGTQTAPPTNQLLTASSQPLLLKLTASETKSLLPALLPQTPHAPPTGHLYQPSNLPPLYPRYCPNLPPTPIRVLDIDTLDATLALISPSPHSPLTSSPNCPNQTAETNITKPPLLLNMANAYHGGGGWLKGALAQEESLCYRSSLSFTLKRRFYPLPREGGIYSPTVLVIRESLAQGHKLLPAALTRPPGKDLQVVSVVSVAAIRDPPLLPSLSQPQSGRKQMCYKYPQDRLLTKQKMRTFLRIAALNAHRTIVLGALGCGAFRNPNTEVVACWREVLGEGEFAGGWWTEVVFAVMDGDGGGGKEGDGNYGVFWRGLDGMLV